MTDLILHPGKERSLFRRHPWVFDTSVARQTGQGRPGDTVTICDAHGKPLAKAAYSPQSKIRARVWTFDLETSIDHVFFKRRVAAAVARRAALPELAGQPGLRLIHAESDGLPGVIADKYGDTVVVQLTSAGAEKWRGALVDGLRQATGCARIYERSDSEVRGLEGLEPATGWLFGEAPAGEIVIEEHGVTMAVDIVAGHKTGFYLDQRDNRRLLAELSRGKRVLNCFCYTGGFSLQALAGGATSVLSIDSSQPALDRAAANPLGQPCRARQPGLQGHQPARLPAAGARRTADDLFVLGRHRRRAVPENRRRRRLRQRAHRTDRPAPARGRRPSGGPGVSRRRVSQGLAAAGRLSRLGDGGCRVKTRLFSSCS